MIFYHKNITKTQIFSVSAQLLTFLVVQLSSFQIRINKLWSRFTFSRSTVNTFSPVIYCNGCLGRQVFQVSKGLEGLLKYWSFIKHVTVWACLLRKVHLVLFNDNDAFSSNYYFDSIVFILKSNTDETEIILIFSVVICNLFIGSV